MILVAYRVLFEIPRQGLFLQVPQPPFVGIICRVFPRIPCHCQGVRVEFKVRNVVMIDLDRSLKRRMLLQHDRSYQAALSSPEYIS